MAEPLRITGPGRARAVAEELNTGRRSRPLAMISIPASETSPWIDVDRLVDEFDDLVDVCILANNESSWAFSEVMPPRTQVFGGAGRVYPMGLAWVHDPDQAKLRFAYSAAEGRVATEHLIADGLAAAAPAQPSVRPAPGPADSESVIATVKGCPTSSQVLVVVDGRYATAHTGVAFPGLASERVFHTGMQIEGVLDPESGQFDIRNFLPDPAERVAAIGDGLILLARIQSVDVNACVAEPYPGVTFSIGREQMLDDELTSDMHDVLTEGEVVAVRASRGDTGELELSLIGFDADDECTAISVFPGGPPWLLPAAPSDAIQSDAGLKEPRRGSVGEVPDQRPPSDPDVHEDLNPGTSPAPRSLFVPAEDVGRPASLAVLTPLVVRPTPSMMVRPRTAGQSERVPDDPLARSQAQSVPPKKILQEMGLELETSRTANQNLKAVLESTRASLHAAESQIRMLESELAQRAHEVTRQEDQLRRLRAQNRKGVQRERRSGARDSQTLFMDPEEQLRFEVEARWVYRIPATDKRNRPLRPYTVGPDFLLSLDEIRGVDRSKVLNVIVDVLTDIAQSSAGRGMHPLRTGTGANDEPVRRGDYTCWRVALQQKTPQARRLHFWRSANDIELSRVVLHDDNTP